MCRYRQTIWTCGCRGKILESCYRAPPPCDPPGENPSPLYHPAKHPRCPGHYALPLRTSSGGPDGGGGGEEEDAEEWRRTTGAVSRR